MSRPMPDQPPTKNEAREQLEADTKVFLRRGGKITEIAQGRTNWKPKAFVMGVAEKREKEQR